MSEVTDPSTVEFSPEEVKEAQQAYERFLAEAKGLSSSEILPFRADVMLALANARQGTNRVFARQSELKGKFTDEEFTKMSEIPSLAMAVVLAHQKMELLTGTTGEFARRLKRAVQLRQIHLHAALSNVAAGNIPKEPVEKIRQGTGSTDMAKDCIALAELFQREEKALENKTPSTPELRKEMSEVGTRLLFLTKPEGAPATKPEDIGAAQELRDRLWTLLDQRYDLLTSAAIRLGGRRGAEEIVPPLQSRQVSPKKA